jgi:4a-hydroxytetrahydrobiopterin dehydratase
VISKNYISSLESTIKFHLNLLREQKDSWKGGKEKLQKTFQFKNFDDAMNFVNQVAKIAEKQNHHPDIQINYNKVKLTITDHEKGEVSDKCHKFVDAINKIDSKKTIHEEKTEKFITCKNCKKKFTQTIHKGKKSLPICPNCGTHNTEKNSVDEGYTDYLLKVLNKQPFQEFQASVDKFMDLKKLKETHPRRNQKHLVNKETLEPEIKIQDTYKNGRTVFISVKLMNELEKYIPQPGLVFCVTEWVRKRYNEENIKGWEMFLD